ncbi:MAG: hypothetical protein AAGI52_12180 [Bacteroidota bacterium]
MSRTRSRRDRRSNRQADRHTAAAVCPECGAEFVAGAEACSDCGVPLVAPTRAGERLHSPDGLVSVGPAFSEDISWPLAEALTDSGLDHHMRPIEAERGGILVFVYEPYVLPQDVVEAERIVAEISARPGFQFTRDEEKEEENTHTPRLRDFELAEPAYRPEDRPNPVRSSWLQAGAFACWWGVMSMLILADSSAIRAGLGIAFALGAVSLHLAASRTVRAHRETLASAAEAERRELEAQDWDAIEEEERRILAETFPEEPGDRPFEDRD